MALKTLKKRRPRLYQTAGLNEGEYPAHIQTKREKKGYDLAMSKGWLYDTRLPNAGYFFNQDALDKALEKAGFNQNTHYFGQKLNKDGLLTLDQTQGDRISFIEVDDADENDRMMKLINTGNWGYNPSTGQMVKLNQSTERQLTEKEHLMDTEKYTRLNVGANQGFTSDEEKSYIKKNFTKKEQEIINKTNKDLRKGYVGNQMKLAYQNPIMYAPGALYMGAIAGPTLLGWGSTDLIGGIAGTSLFDAAGYYGGYHGIKHGPEDVKEFIDDPSLSNAGDVALDLLGVAGGGVSTYRGLSNLAKSTQIPQIAKSTQIPQTWAKGVTNYGKVGEDEIVGILKNMKAQGKYLDDIGYDVSKHLNSKNIKFHGTSPTGQTIVEVALPNGKTQLFYKSTDLSGKGVEGVWQPFGGNADIPGTKGWFIKDGIPKGETNLAWGVGNHKDFYGSKSFRDIADNLDLISEVEGWDMSKQILRSKLKQTGGFRKLKKRRPRTF